LRSQLTKTNADNFSDRTWKDSLAKVPPRRGEGVIDVESGSERRGNT